MYNFRLFCDRQVTTTSCFGVFSGQESFAKSWLSVSGTKTYGEATLKILSSRFPCYSKMFQSFFGSFSEGDIYANKTIIRVPFYMAWFVLEIEHSPLFIVPETHEFLMLVDKHACSLFDSSLSTTLYQT